jgi:hypothetical protein
MSILKVMLFINKIPLIIIVIIFSFIFNINLKALEINMLCTTNSDRQSIKNFNDLIVNINSESKEITIGGLTFVADKILVTESNIKWSANNIENLYEESSGETTGTLGRFSGSLSLTFKKNNSIRHSKIDLLCKDFKMKDRKF